MKWIRVPALTGCFAVALSVPAMWAQANPTSGAGETGSGAGQTGTPSGAGQTDTTSGAGQTGGAASTSGTQQQGNAAGADKKFVKEAMKGGMAEVQLGKMAAEKASSPDVKQFGQKMVDDHSKLNDQITPIATQMGVTPPPPSAKEKALQTKLQGLSGDAFDKAYMSAMVKDHQKDLKEFQNEASSGKNPQVKDAASQGAQVIQQHLQMAQDIAQKVGAGGGKMGKNAKGATSDTTGMPATSGAQKEHQ